MSSSPVEVARASLPYSPEYQRYMVKSRNYAQQYSHIYTKRMLQLKPTLTAAALQKWGTGPGEREAKREGGGQKG